MRVQSALLCEFAEVRNGLLTAVSTGITRVVPGAAFTPYVAGYFLSEVNEQRLVHEFSVTVLDQDAHQLWRAQGAMQVGTVVGSFQGEPLLAPFVMRIPPTPLIPGARYDVRVRSDDASEVLWFYTVAPPGSQPFRNPSSPVTSGEDGFRSHLLPGGGDGPLPLRSSAAVFTVRRGAPGRAHEPLLSLRVHRELAPAGSRPTSDTDACWGLHEGGQVHRGVEVPVWDQTTALAAVGALRQRQLDFHCLAPGAGLGGWIPPVGLDGTALSRAAAVQSGAEAGEHFYHVSNQIVGDLGVVKDNYTPALAARAASRYSTPKRARRSRCSTTMVPTPGSPSSPSNVMRWPPSPEPT